MKYQVTAHVACILFVLFTLFGPSAASAQDDDYGDEDLPTLGDLSNSYDFQKLGGMAGRLAPHGDDLMGDKVDKNTGGITFEHTDISIPGNSTLEVALRRKITQGHSYFTPYQHGFGDWLIDLPIAYTAFAPDKFNPDEHMPKFNGGCLMDYGSMKRDAFVGGALVAWRNFTSGVTLNVPGQGLSGFTADPKTPKDPKADWISAPNTTDHAGRCATQVIAPDGTKYKFGRYAIREAEAFKAPFWRNFGSGDHSSWGQVMGYINRKYAVYLITEVEDVHGNWVRYDYTNDARAELTRIYSNDQREIRLHYHSEYSRARNSRRVSHVTANNRTWHYEYASNFYLHKVTLPDGRYWALSGNNSGYINLPDGRRHALPNSTQGMALMGYEIHDSYQCLPTDLSFSIKHPDGATGTFRLLETRHIKAASNLGLYDDDWDHYMAPMDIPFVNDNTNCAGTLQRPAFDRPIGWPIYRVMSLASKTISGNGLATASWHYDYRNYSGGSLAETWTKITGPDGTERTYTHQAVGGFHGALKRIDVRPASGPGESITYQYKALTTPGNPGCFAGGDYGDSVGACAVFKKRPLGTITHRRDGDTYTTDYEYRTNSTGRLLDYGAPSKITRASSVQTHKRVTELSYWHNTSDHIIGLPSKVSRNQKVLRENTFNNKGQLTEQRRFGDRYATFGYHADGTLAWRRDALSRTTQWGSYYRGLPRVLTQADGNLIRRSVNSFGLVTGFTDALNNSTSYDYDSAGRLRRITPPASWDPTEFDYANLGAGVTQTMTRGDFTEITQYDRMNRPVSVHKNGGASSQVFTKTEYDAIGRVVFQSWPSTSPDPTSGVTTSYDGLGRVTQTRENVAPYAATRTAYLSGNRTQVTDPKGNVTTTTASGFGSPNNGNVTQIKNSISTTTITHDAWDNPTEITQRDTASDGANTRHTQRFYYDNALRLCRSSVPESGDTVYAYNAAGEMTHYSAGHSAGTSCALPSANRVAMSYDAMGRNTTINYPGTDLDVSKTFDANGNLATIANAHASWAYRYNTMDQLIEERLSTDGASYTLGYDYDSGGHLDKMTYPGNEVVDYEVNALGQTVKITGYVKSASYHPNGAIKSITYQNNTTQTFGINARQMPASVRVNNGSGRALRHLTLAYDANQNLTQLQDHLQSQHSNSFGYDALNRLTQASGSWGSGTIAYDALGNITAKRMSSHSMSYDYDTKNRLDNISGSEVYLFDYDTRGNVIENTKQAFTYNLANQMTATSDGYHYAYDGHGRRVKKGRNGKNNYFVYSADGKLVHSLEASGKTTDYIHLGDKLVAQIDRVTTLSNLEEQDTNEDNHQSRFRIQNYWARDWYINIETGDPEASSIHDSWASAIWFFDSLDDYFRIQNFWQPDQYLHIENGVLSSSSAPEGWHSAHWILDEVADVAEDVQGQVYRIQNRWDMGMFLNVEGGELAASPAGPGYWSSFWILHNIDDDRSLDDRVTYSHFDQLGSVIAKTDEDGQLTRDYHYMPFGKSLEVEQSNAPGYTGHVFDTELGLNYMQARYYDPVVGRFYANDPVDALTFIQKGNIQGFNRYAYANNNPYKYTDPSGENPVVVARIVGAACSASPQCRKAAADAVQTITEAAAEIFSEPNTEGPAGGGGKKRRRNKKVIDDTWRENKEKTMARIDVTIAELRSKDKTDQIKKGKELTSLEER